MEEQKQEKNVTMTTGMMTTDADLMISALISILRLRAPSIGTSAMFAILSAHFVNLGCSVDEFVNMCIKSYTFYKIQIDEKNANRDKNDED